MADSVESQVSDDEVDIADLLELANALFEARRVDSEDDILEILRSLEEVRQENFPYYQLVRWLRSSIEDHLEDFVLSSDVTTADDVDPEAWKAAAREVFNSIMESPQMVSLLDNIKKGNNPGESLARDLLHLNISPSRRASMLSMCDSDSSMDDAWWNHSILPQQYQQLAEDISSRKPVQIRIDSLRILVGAHLSDAVEGPHWTQFRRGLREAICDENEVIFSLGLKIHAKLIASSSVHIATKEAFLNLIESLSTHFTSRKMLPYLPTYDSGIDLNKPLHFRIMKIVQLISDAQKEIPKEWIRFSTRKVEEMIESFVDLLAMHTYDGCTKERFLFPLHLLSVVDPNAVWSRHWLNGLFSRNLLLRALERTPPLIRFLDETILKWMEDFDAIQYWNIKTGLHYLKDNPHSLFIPGYIVQYTVFTSCVVMLSSLLPYEGGRSLFPIASSEDETLISLNMLALATVDFLNNHSEEIGIAGPVPILVDFVAGVLNEAMIPTELPVVLAILQPVLEAHADKSQEATYPLQSHTVGLVQAMVGSEEGIRTLMGGRKPRGSFRHRTSTENLGCLAKTLADYMTAVFKNHRNADPKLLDALLSICRKMQLSHELFLYLEPTGLFQTLNNLHKYLKTKIEHEMLSPYSKPLNSYCNLMNRLIQCYLQILKTPLGMLCVAKDGILYDVMQDLFENSLVSWSRPSDRQLVSLACCFSGGARAVREERVVAEQLMLVWQGSEGSPEPRPGSERHQLEVRQEAVSILASVCSSLVSVQCQLSDRTGSEETLLALCGPCSLPELLEATLLEEEPGQGVADSYTTPPPPSEVQLLGLSLLCHLVGCTDTTLLLQNRFSLQEQLLLQQRENAVSEEEGSAIIIDELSVLRNHILVRCLLLGGPWESVVPPPHMPSSGDFPWPLFGSLPLPREYTKAAPRTVSKKQGDLQKYLTDTRPGVHDAQWLVHCRKAARSTLGQCPDEIKGLVLLDTLKQVLRASPNASFLLGNVNSEQLTPEDLSGINYTIRSVSDLVARYGAHLRLIQTIPQMFDNLGQLIKFSRTLKPQAVEGYSGFDWLVATVFIALCGNMDRCQSFLQSLAITKAAPLVWSALAERRQLRLRVETTLGHLVEMLLQTEEPQVLLAFQKSGVSVSCVVNGWLRRCFWGVLDWSGVTQWLLLALVSEPDLTVYLALALLLHLRPRVVSAAASGTLAYALSMEHVEKFSVGEALPLVERLTKRHRHKILPLLQAVLNCQ